MPYSIRTSYLLHKNITAQ